MNKIINVRIVCVIVLSLWFFSHLPFLSADADINISYGSRGPFTDEGLNTSQVRNFINHGRFDVLECDNFLKTPLFSAYLFVPFKISGTELEVARLSVIALIMLSCLMFFFLRSFRLILVLLVPTTLMLFPIHQHSHFSLSEMCAISMIMLAAVFYVHNKESGQPRFLGWSFLFLFLSVLFKIQFVYVLAIPTLSIIFEKAIEERKLLPGRHLAPSIWYVALSLLIILLAWFLPFKNEFELIAKQQSGSFSFDKLSVDGLTRNLREHFINKYNIFFVLCFTAACMVAARDIVKKRVPQPLRALMMFSFAWFVLETHKLPMEYLPARYLVSLYFAVGLFISIVFAHILISKRPFIFKAAVVTSAIILFALNMFNYYRAWERRTFVISELNAYLAAYNLKDKTVIGAWAPSLTWESKSLSFPVWKAFLRTSTPLETFRPSIIISEEGEEDSEKAYSSLGIDLLAISDSIKETRIAHWNVNIYWINPKYITLRR